MRRLVTEVRAKQMTTLVLGDKHRKIRRLKAQAMLKTVVSKRKKGHIFVNADGIKLSMAWFKDRINHYAKLLGIQKDVNITIPEHERSIPSILLPAWPSGRQA